MNYLLWSGFQYPLASLHLSFSSPSWPPVLYNLTSSGLCIWATDFSFWVWLILINRLSFSSHNFATNGRISCSFILCQFCSFREPWLIHKVFIKVESNHWIHYFEQIRAQKFGRNFYFFTGMLTGHVEVNFFSHFLPDKIPEQCCLSHSTRKFEKDWLEKLRQEIVSTKGLSFA